MSKKTKSENDKVKPVVSNEECELYSLNLKKFEGIIKDMRRETALNKAVSFGQSTPIITKGSSKHIEQTKMLLRSAASTSLSTQTSSTADLSQRSPFIIISKNRESSEKEQVAAPIINIRNPPCATNNAEIPQ
jgi:hypothetical protein